MYEEFLKKEAAETEKKNKQKKFNSEQKKKEKDFNKFLSTKSAEMDKFVKEKVDILRNLGFSESDINSYKKTMNDQKSSFIKKGKRKFGESQKAEETAAKSRNYETSSKAPYPGYGVLKPEYVEKNHVNKQNTTVEPQQINENKPVHQWIQPKAPEFKAPESLQRNGNKSYNVHEDDYFTRGSVPMNGW